MPTLTTAAVVASRIEPGTLVASPGIRHPVSLAREVTALDDISAGRFWLGVGAGSDADYHTAVFGPAGRLARQDARVREFVELLDALLTSGPVTRSEAFDQPWPFEAHRAVANTHECHS